MTINSQRTIVRLQGNGVSTSFSFPYPYFAASDLVVALFDQTSAVNVAPAPTLNGSGKYDYRLDGVSDPATGEYPFTNVIFNNPPLGNHLVVIRTQIPETQNANLIDGAKLPASAVNAGLDRVTALAQDLKNSVGQALIFPDQDAGPFVMPSAPARANQAMGFDGAGDPGLVQLAAGLVPGSLPVWLSQQASLAAADALATATGAVLMIDKNVALGANTVLSSPAVIFAGGVVTLGAFNLTGNFFAPPKARIFNVSGAGIAISTSGRVWPAWFGAFEDGVSDDTAAYLAMRKSAAAAARTNTGYGADANKLGMVAIDLDAGATALKSAGGLLASTDFASRTNGFGYRGLGIAITQLLYEPAASGAFIYNNDAVIGFSVQDMDINGNDAGSDLVYSTSAGGAQSLTMRNVSITGRWRYLWNLAGTNNNSENLFDHVIIAGARTTGLYVDAAIGAPGDQFLNHWFRNCLDNGAYSLVDMARGGHVKITDSDHSGFSPGADLYKINLRGNSHAQGVCYFIERGGRYELGSAHAKLVYSEWPQGTIYFDGIDTSSQSGFWPTNVIAKFNYINVPGPKLRFTVSDLMGTEEFDYQNSDWQTQKSVVYDQVDFSNVATIGAHFAFTLSGGGGNLGGAPVVRVTNARALQATIGVVPHVSKNWRTSFMDGTGQYFPVSFKQVDGALPLGSANNCIKQFEPDHIVDTIIVNIPSGSNTSGASVTPKLLDGNGATVWTGDVINPYSGGLVKKYDVVIDLAKVGKQQLQLSLVGADQESAGDVIVKVMG